MYLGRKFNHAHCLSHNFFMGVASIIIFSSYCAGFFLSTFKTIIISSMQGFTFSYSVHATHGHVKRHPCTLTKSTKVTMSALVTVSGGWTVK